MKLDGVVNDALHHIYLDRVQARTFPSHIKPLSGGFVAPLELGFLGGAGEGGDGRAPALDQLGDRVEVAGAHLALMPRRGIPALLCHELGFLQAHESGHTFLRVAAGEFVHSVVERMEAGERDELELVAHRPQLPLKLRDSRVVEVALPVERRGAVVSEHRAGMDLAYRLGEAAGEAHGGGACFAPDEISVRGVGQPARYRLLEAVANAEESIGGALTG